MKNIDLSKYMNLNSNAFEGQGEKTAPEDEVFHAVYVPGNLRENHLNITEELDKIQIRGVAYNLDEAHMIIINIKETYQKIEKNQSTGRDEIVCFSYKDTDPVMGSCGKLCGLNRAARTSQPFCEPCRSQLLVIGIYCDKDGFIMLKDDKPIYIFIKGKGIRYSKVFTYINELTAIDPNEIGRMSQDDKYLQFEKTQLNHKRFVTRISVGSDSNSRGVKFSSPVMEKDIQIDYDNIQRGQLSMEELLKITEEMQPDMKKKFDFTEKVKKNFPSQGSSGGGRSSEADKFNYTANNKNEPPHPADNASGIQSAKGANFKFDSVKFGG